MKTRHITLILAAGMLLLGSLRPSLAQDGPTMEQAQAHFQAQEWAEAASAYEAITEREPTNRLAWFRLAAALQGAGEYDRALEVNQRMENGGAPPVVIYNQAVLYALKKEPEQALDKLEKAVGAGFSNVQALSQSADLAALRSDARFKKVLEQVDRNARPCEYDENYRAFDFWVGDWDVFSTQGQLVGTNKIEKKEQGCFLLESWTGNGGSTGTSMNYYDSGKKQWTQVWMSANGTAINMSGGLDENGSMVLVGEIGVGNGQNAPFRATWTLLPDGRVRQFMEQSNDGGETWNPWFEGLYVRQNTSKAEQ